jgi:cell division protein FtsB
MRSTARVRWDRLGKLAMLGVLAGLLYLYASASFSLLSTWKEASGERGQLAALERQHASLEAMHASLASPATIMAEARRLGMIHPGERAYVITGLPSN